MLLLYLFDSFIFFMERNSKKDLTASSMENKTKINVFKQHRDKAAVTVAQHPTTESDGDNP
jgi:hypothetical protein